MANAVDTVQLNKTPVFDPKTGLISRIWTLFFAQLATSGQGSLQSANNLSDVASETQSRQNLGAAASGVNADIKSLTGLTTPLPVSEGGTGSHDADDARVALVAAKSGINSDITELTGLTTPVSVVEGGTGASTAALARVSLSAAKSGANADITSLTGLTSPLAITEGGTSSATAPAARSALAVGGLADSNAWSGVNNFSLAIAGALGGWLSWTPTIGASGAMTVSSVGIADAQYIQIGPIIYFKLWVSPFTLGGTANTIVTATLPIPQVGASSAILSYVVQGAGSLSLAVGYISGGTSTLNIALNGGGNWTLTTSTILCEGFYRSA